MHVCMVTVYVCIVLLYPLLARMDQPCASCESPLRIAPLHVRQCVQVSIPTCTCTGPGTVGCLSVLTVISLGDRVEICNFRNSYRARCTIHRVDKREATRSRRGCSIIISAAKMLRLKCALYLLVLVLRPAGAFRPAAHSHAQKLLQLSRRRDHTLTFVRAAASTAAAAATAAAVIGDHAAGRLVATNGFACATHPAALLASDSLLHG